MGVVGNKELRKLAMLARFRADLNKLNAAARLDSLPPIDTTSQESDYT